MLNTRNNVQGLDLLRGLCGYIVAICHFQLLVNKIKYFEYISILFVEFFFILSGFVLAPQIIKIIEEKKKIIIFFQRRWMRTIPLYILSLIIVSLITNNIFNKDFFLYLFFLNKSIPNLLNSDYFAVAWSLAVEEYFYLIFPIIIYFFFNKNNFKKSSIILFIFLSLICFFFSFFVDSNFYRTGTFLRIDSILLGFLLSVFSIEKKIKIHYVFLTFIALVFLYWLYYKNQIYHFETFYNKILFLNLMKLISIFTLLLFYKINFGNFFSRLFKLLANQTYSIYLLHLPLIYLINSNIITNFGLTGFCILLFCISSVIFYFFEKPILLLRPKYEKN